MGKVSKALNKADSTLETSNTTPDAIQKTEEPRIRVDENILKNVPPSSSTSPHPSIISTDNWDERLISSTVNFSGVAESFRKLRTMILHPESGSPPHRIMVLSSDPQEGKSFVCANLGINFAQSLEKHALMVDCDLRRPSLHNLFGVKGQSGLVNYLKSGANISDLIVGTGLNKLSLIPAGIPPENPSELLSSLKMSNMLEELTNRYDDRLILLDTPPFHAASETLVLSQLVDKIVLVVRWGKSGRENIKKMVDIVGREKIIGVVLNAFEMNILDKRVQGVGYHNYYTESYY